jgi:hypothetical protein
VLGINTHFQPGIGSCSEENTEGSQNSEGELKHELTVVTWRSARLLSQPGTAQPIDFTIRPCIVYTQGMRIGELSLGADFGGVLLWRMIDNRPFLRCMHGYGLCPWRSATSTRPTRFFGGCFG